MIKKILLLGSFIYLLGCKSSINKISIDNISFEIEDTIEPYTVTLGQIKVELLQIYTDSIRDYKKTGVIPNFFKDPLLDIKYNFYNFDVGVISLRKSLVDSINNRDLLNSIINSGDVMYKIRIDSTSLPEYFPSIEYSTYELVKKRLLQIDSIEHSN
jgi:hypothetical protein